ncbi:MAG: hypothetical protein ABI591_14750 [Kofleriaceae bacterium]
MSWRVTRMISDATIGTAIVLFHVALADRLEQQRRIGDRRRPQRGLPQADAPRDPVYVAHE